MNIASIVAAAEARINEINPSLKTRVELELSPLEQKRLKQSLDFALIPSLMAATADAAEEGHNVEPMLRTLNELCGVSNALPKDNDETITLELDPFRTRALTQGLDDILIPAMLRKLPSPAAEGAQQILQGVSIICSISIRLQAGIKSVIAGLEAEHERLAAEREDEEIAALKRDMKAA